MAKTEKLPEFIIQIIALLADVGIFISDRILNLVSPPIPDSFYGVLTIVGVLGPSGLYTFLERFIAAKTSSNKEDTEKEEKK